MNPSGNESNLNQTKNSPIKELLDKLNTSENQAADTQSIKRVETLNQNLDELNKVIKEQTKIALKNGFGAQTANAIEKNNVGRVNQEEKSSGLRKYLIGNDKGGMIDKMLTKREGKQALAKEKKEFVDSAINNDPRSIALKNLKGEDYAKADAEKRFAEVKAKEADVTAAKARIDASKNAGYAPKKRDLEALDKQTKELAEIDPRMQSQAKANAKNIIAQGGDESTLESAKIKADSDNKMIALQNAEGANEMSMGKTLIDSLDVQKQMLEAIKAGGTGGGGGGGGSILETAADLAGNIGGKGKMLGKAGKFLSKAGPGLLKGGLLSAGGELVEMGGDALTEAGHEKIGGAVSTLGTAGKYAGYGAMLGSVVPGLGTAVGAGVGGAIGAGVGLYNNWSNIGIGDSLSEGYQGVKAMGGRVGDSLSEGYQGAKAMGGRVGDSLSEGYQNVKGWFGNKASAVGNTLSEGYQGAKTLGGNIKEYGERGINAVGDTVYNTKQSILESADSATGGALTSVSNTVSNAKSSARASVRSMFGLQNGAKTEDLGGGKKKTTNEDGSYSVTDGSGTKNYDKDGNLISKQGPSFGGASETKNVDGTSESNYNMGGMSIKKVTSAEGGEQSFGKYTVGGVSAKRRETLTARQVADRNSEAKFEAPAVGAGIGIGTKINGDEVVSSIDASKGSRAITVTKPDGGTYTMSMDEAIAASGQRGIGPQATGPVSMGAVSGVDGATLNAPTPVAMPTPEVALAAPTGDDFKSKWAAKIAAQGQKGDKLIGNSRANEDIRADGNKPAASPTTIINSPTNISKSTTNMDYRSPIRNPESSVNRFNDSRYNAY